MNGIRRVNVDAVRRFFESLSQEQLQQQNQLDQERSEREHEKFVEGYLNGVCYLCGKPFKTMSRSEPCVHWLLRQCKFKKKDFPLVYTKFGYTQIAAFTRWVANQERYQGNINDLEHEKSERKIFEYTVKWKNIEWTFDCSTNDYEGHKGTHSEYPHYHLQMRIDGKQFINFGDFHIPLSEEDLFHIDLTRSIPDMFHHSFGSGGAGMQSAAEIAPEDIVENTTVVDDESIATYSMQTMIYGGEGGIDGEALHAMINESRQTGEPLAKLAHKYMPQADSIKTIISPADSIPEIGRRTERKRR